MDRSPKRYTCSSNKQLLDEVFCDIQNNQGRGKCYQPKPKAEADNTYRDLDYSGYHKTESNNRDMLFFFRCVRDTTRQPFLT